MSIPEQQLKRIQDKLQQLLRQHGALQKENQQLKEELRLTKNNNQQSQESIEQLKQQVEILKLSTGEMSEEEKKQFEKRINGYLREIDRCIAMLGQ